MNRRDFLSFQKSNTKKVIAAPSPANDVPELDAQPLIPSRPPVFAGLDPYNGTWNIAQVTHLLRRATFGAKYSDVKRLLAMSPQQAVTSVLADFSAAPPVPVNNYNTDGEFADPEVPFGEPWINADWNVEAEGYRITSLRGWWLQNIITQEATIAEKMVLFWFNHIPVQFDGVFFGRWLYKYYLTLRQHALGNFKEMVKAVTLAPAMLEYLNGQYNSAAEPDENYARELQELFCIGKGPNANFTEEDVRAAARVLTGWRYRFSDDVIYFSEVEHDKGDKRFSAFYGNRIIRGRTGQNGKLELDELLDMLFENDETALFVCRKLYRFFVYHDIDAMTEQNIIQPLAQIFRANNYDIQPVVDKLLRSQHFFDTLNRGAMLRSGIDYLMGMTREMNVKFPSANLTDHYQINNVLVFASYLLQQFIGDPPNVSGWPAYYQVPQFDKHWVTTDTLPKRMQLTDGYLYAGIQTADYRSILEMIETTKQFSDPGNPNKLVDDATAWLFHIEISPTVKFILKTILLSGQISDYYWTNAWNDYIADPDNDMKREAVQSRLLGFYYYMFHLEEYQLC